MKTSEFFPARLSPAEAIQLQLELAAQVVIQGDLDNVERIAALDAARPPGRGLVAVAVLYDLKTNRVIETGIGRIPEAEVFPYIPGLLSFREGPGYLQALASLTTAPEALLVDGQGIAHPRGLGIASHLGLALSIPSVGVAKSRLYGHAQLPLEQEAGAAVPLVQNGKLLGYVYRSRSRVKPLYISPGHLVGASPALDLVRRLPGRYRLPEPLHLAHRYATQAAAS